MEKVKERTTGWGLWRLRAGDKIRVTEGAPVRQVYRVSPGAAYYTVESTSTFEVLDKSTGEMKSITRTNRRSEYISPYSFVEMIERGTALPQPIVSVKPVKTKPEPKKELEPIKYSKRNKRRKV